MGFDDLMEIGATAVMLALVIRWLAPVDIEFRWLFSAGMLGLLARSGTLAGLSSSVPMVPVYDFFMLTGVIVAFFGVVQVFRGP